MELHRMTADEATRAREEFPRWRFIDNDRMERTMLLKDFAQAFALMCRIAIISEGKNHHPIWKNSYNKLEISLSTHEVDGLSIRDLELAREIDLIAPEAER